MRRRAQARLAGQIVSLGAFASVTGSSVRAWLPGHGGEPVTVRAAWLPGDRVWPPGRVRWPRRRAWVWHTARGEGIQPRAHTGRTAECAVSLLRRSREQHGWEEA